MTGKRVLLLGGNFSPELTGIGKYNGEMINWLAANGYKCTVITSYPYYPQWKVQFPYAKSAFWFKKEKIKCSLNPSAAPIQVYRCPQYVPKQPTGLRRILLDASFSLSALTQLFFLLFKKQYQYVIVVVPAFQVGLLGILYKKLRGAKFLYHIQDLQIDAAKELNIIRSKVLLKMLFKIERFILRNADVVSSISGGMIQKIKGKCDRAVVPFPNWVDTMFYYPIKDNKTLKRKFGFREEDKIILYSGAIGEKQGLEAVIFAAQEFKHLSCVKFVICGTGPYKERLQQLQQKLNLKNVQFESLRPLEEFNQFLNIADIHLVLQMANASDLVMPSKLTTILAVGGVAIVSATKNSSLYQVVSSNNIGYAIEPENQNVLNNAIRKAIESNNDEMRRSARAFAEEYLSVNKVLSEYVTYLD